MNETVRAKRHEEITAKTSAGEPHAAAAGDPGARINARSELLARYREFARAGRGMSFSLDVDLDPVWLEFMQWYEALIAFAAGSAIPETILARLPNAASKEREVVRRLDAAEGSRLHWVRRPADYDVRRIDGPERIPGMAPLLAEAARRLGVDAGQVTVFVLYPPSRLDAVRGHVRDHLKRAGWSASQVAAVKIRYVRAADGFDVKILDVRGKMDRSGAVFARGVSMENRQSIRSGEEGGRE